MIPSLPFIPKHLLRSLNPILRPTFLDKVGELVARIKDYFKNMLEIDLMM